MKNLVEMGERELTDLHKILVQFQNMLSELSGMDSLEAAELHITVSGDEYVVGWGSGGDLCVCVRGERE